MKRGIALGAAVVIFSALMLYEMGRGSAPADAGSALQP